MMLENNTNQAWERLYKRLEYDNLLDGKNITIKKTFVQTNSFKWFASLAAAIIVGIIIISTLNTSAPKNMYTLHNEEGNATLISTLKDGSIVYLANNTSLKFFEGLANKREVFLQGNAFFDISENKNCPFSIETDLVRIDVIGTAFNVESENNNICSVSVQRGEVRVVSKNNNQSLHVKAGETALLNSGNLITLPNESNKQPIARYVENIRFKDERLVDVVEALNRNCIALQIKVDTNVQDRRLTVAFSGETPEVITQLICLALDLEYSQQQNMIHIYEKK